MARYALLNGSGQLLKEREFGADTPPNVSHKGLFWVPIIVEPDPTYDGQTETLSNYITTIVPGVSVTRHREVQQVPIDAGAVNKERERRIALGTYVNTANIIFFVDTDQNSIRNIQGLGSAATLRIMQGDTTTITTFRDGNNVNRDLAPMDIITLSMTVATYIKNVYNASWEIKDDPNGLPANLKALRDDPRWP